MKFEGYLLTGFVALALAATATPARAQTMLDALSLAYSNNPDLNAQRSAGDRSHMSGLFSTSTRLSAARSWPFNSSSMNRRLRA